MTDKIIDLHTHVFNSAYVPLGEIINKSWGINRPTAFILEKLVNAIARTSDLDYSRAFKLASHGRKSFVHDDLNSQYDFYSEVLDDLCSQVLNHPNASEQSLVLTQTLEEIEFIYGDETEVEDIHKGIGNLFSKTRNLLKKFLMKAFSKVEQGIDKLDFVFKMLCSETYLVDQLRGYYKSQYTENYLLIHLMMDMQYPFNAKKMKLDFDSEQIPRMKRLAMLSEGSLIGFSAFCPLRAYKKRLSAEEIISRVETSLAAGMCGFKFYPPMGYRPCENDAPLELEAITDVFFDYCESHAIPIFTHCTPAGFEVEKGESGANAHPKYWQARLDKNPNLILCFGHAGGGRRIAEGEEVQGWLASGGLDSDEWTHQNNYARCVANLCREYESVYCEFGYLHEVMNSEDDKNRFITRLSMELMREGGSYSLSDKIMYGSDWHMPDMINDLDDYIDVMQQIFTESGSGLSDVKNRFFYENALKYLNLESYLSRAKYSMGESYCESVAKRVGLS